MDILRARDRRVRLLGEVGLAAVVGLVVAVALTWPLTAGLGHQARDGVDPRFEAWAIDWVQHAVRHPSGLFDANLFAPQRGTLAYSDPLLGVAVPLLPLRWIGLTPMAVHNVALLLGFALSAASGYLFGRVVAGSIGVGVVTGAALAFGPFNTFESNHVQVVFHPGIGVAGTAAWWLAERSGRPGVTGRDLLTPAVLLGGSVAWQTTSSFYAGVYAGVVAVVVLACRGRTLGRKGLMAGASALAVAAAVGLLVALPYLSRGSDLADYERTLTDLRGLGADFLATDPRLSVWGGLLGGGGGWPAFGAPSFPGLVLVALAPWGWWCARRDGRRTVARTGLALIVVGVLMALGTSDEGWRQYTPYRLVFELVPGFGALRATARALLIALPGLGLLAGLGADDLGHRLARRVHRPVVATATAVCAVAAVLLLVEGFAPWTDLQDTRVRAVDEALADLDEPGGVVYLPVPPGPADELSIADFGQALIAYRTTAHHRSTPNGFSGYFPPSYVAMKSVMAGFPDPASIAYLRDIGVRFVVVDPSVAGTAWEPLLDGGGPDLELVGVYDGSLLYRLVDGAGT